MLSLINLVQKALDVKKLVPFFTMKDTIRIHCKKWDQLLHIEGLLDQIDQAKHFEKVCLPISMKTKSQKKGFFVYLKFYRSQDVPEVLDHIRKTGLYKALIADRVTGSKKSA
jgi:hypothetical protein